MINEYDIPPIEDFVLYYNKYNTFQTTGFVITKFKTKSKDRFKYLDVFLSKENVENILWLLYLSITKKYNMENSIRLWINKNISTLNAENNVQATIDYLSNNDCGEDVLKKCIYKFRNEDTVIEAIINNKSFNMIIFNAILDLGPSQYILKILIDKLYCDMENVLKLYEIYNACNADNKYKILEKINKILHLNILK